MAKKKKNVTPITFSDQELIPSVIGTIDEKEKSIWPFIIIFLLLIGFIIGLPMISNYFHGTDVVEEKTKPNSGFDNEEKPNEKEVTFYLFSKENTVMIDGISIHSFQLNDHTITFAITNHSEAKNYLANRKFYLELYDNNQMFLQRIKLPSENISKGSTSTYQYDLTVSKSNIFQFTIEEKSENDYPAVNLKKENDDTYSLTCSKKKEKLVYLFDSEQKLMKITDTLNYSSKENNYTDLLTDYRQKVLKYDAIEGVHSNIVEITTGFTVSTDIELSKIDEQVLNSALNNQAYYKKDTNAKVVYFEMSAMNYQCN